MELGADHLPSIKSPRLQASVCCGCYCELKYYKDGRKQRIGSIHRAFVRSWNQIGNQLEKDDDKRGIIKRKGVNPRASLVLKKETLIFYIYRGLEKLTLQHRT